MGLLSKACETYDNLPESLYGQGVELFPPVAPVSHMIVNAHIEITLDAQGNFRGAKEVNADDAKTVIPVTEESASRTGDNDRAHPLSDQLRYLAPYGGSKYAAYVAGLEKWASSEYSHPKVKAVLAYIKGGTILENLAKAGCITLDGQGIPQKGGKQGTTEYGKCLIRWIVLGCEGSEPAFCWQDRSLLNAFTDYYRGQRQGEKILCMLSGTEEIPAQNHPKGVIASNYGAKLISANDTSGFTFRGRLTDASQACTVGYEASQKAHNALQWLASGPSSAVFGGRTFICWNPKGKPVPNAVKRSRVKAAQPAFTPTDYGQRLQEALAGYRQDLPDTEDVIIAAFDAATTGRLSVTYYNELRASDFLNRLEQWYRSCALFNGPFGIEAPSIFQIVSCAFGVQRQDKGKIEADDRIVKEQVQRMLRCVVDKAPVPQDLVSALARRASMPLAYSSQGKTGWADSNRQKVLFTACAVIRKYHNDRTGREEWSMILEPQKKDRSYQFGRLLAVLEKAERDTYEDGEGREPNAIRLQALFRERPQYGFRVIHERLTPYFEKLLPRARIYYKNLIGEILSQLDSESALNRPLEDTYLLGYYLQRKELYTKKDLKNTASEEDSHAE